MNYSRSIDELQMNASIWWPRFLAELETNGSIIPTLLETQEQFVAALTLAGQGPFSIFEVIQAANFPGNLFIKHLSVLADVGGESLQRINTDFSALFPRKTATGRHLFGFAWDGEDYEYTFEMLPVRSLTNVRLGIDGKGLMQPQQMSPLYRDVAAILLFGSACLDGESTASTLSKCELGGLLGNAEAAKLFVSQRYIWVSRITNGAQANSLGQLAQTFVVDFLRNQLDESFQIVRNGRISIGEAGHFPFDVVVCRNNRCIGVEVSFQVTTNSTIERKANEAEHRFLSMHEAGHFLAYVVDGAGNFQRRSAVAKICTYSDCTVAYTNEELDVLLSFIQEKLG